MKTSLQYSLNDIVAKYLDKDLDRFLKRLYRIYWYELAFSVTLKKWEKEVPGIKREIMCNSNYRYPGHVAHVMNVHKVMMKHYGFYLDIEDYKISQHIEDVLSWRIRDYVNARNSRRTKELGYSVKLHSKKEAIKEMKARGFIDINDFEDYNKNMGHVTSRKGLGIPTLIYPQNYIYSDQNYREIRFSFTIPHVHNVYGLIGVQGFSRISTPNQR